MASSSKFSQNKRGRDEYSNGGLALPDAKRTYSLGSVQGSNTIALLEEINIMHAINGDPKETCTAIQLEDKRQIGVMKSLEDEVGLKGDEYGIDQKGSGEIGSIEQITDHDHKSTSVAGTGDMISEEYLTYYDEVRAELGFFVDHTAEELGIIMNFLDGDSMANMYSDAVYCYSESTAVFSESLWEDDIWQLNGNRVSENDCH